MTHPIRKRPEKLHDSQQDVPQSSPPPKPVGHMQSMGRVFDEALRSDDHFPVETGKQSEQRSSCGEVSCCICGSFGRDGEMYSPIPPSSLADMIVAARFSASFNAVLPPTPLTFVSMSQLADKEQPERLQPCHGDSPLRRHCVGSISHEYYSPSTCSIRHLPLSTADDLPRSYRSRNDVALKRPDQV
jgi:hypothetical protein